MFKKNEAYKMGQLFGVEESFTPRQKKMWNESKEKTFFTHVFCQIDETLFAPLFSDALSRPNYPVNRLVGAIFLQHHFDWTVEELFQQLNFNLLTRQALGFRDLETEAFCEATYYNFRQRVNQYQIQTGINLFEQVFDNLTQKQLRELKIKTQIQRADSFLVASNIQNFSRFQLAVEILRRLARALDEPEKAIFDPILAPYLKPQSANQYVYQLKRENMEAEWQKIGETYAQIYDGLQARRADSFDSIQAFRVFERFFTEHFTRLEAGVALKPAEELSSDCLQAPDDEDATYRKKREQESQGFSVHLTETCHPDNEINLITDLAVAPNNQDDSKILAQRLEKMVEKTPELDELHFDGGYGSEANDEKMAQLGVAAIQTAIKGRAPEVELEIEPTETGEAILRCPGGQTVPARQGRKRLKAAFDLAICQDCPFAQKCPTLKQKKCRVYYFDETKIRQQKRAKALKKLPPERQKLRANVEATVREMGLGLTNKKLRVRGAFNAGIYAFSTAIGVNFGRIHRLGDVINDLFLSWHAITHRFVAQNSVNFIFSRPPSSQTYFFARFRNFRF